MLAYTTWLSPDEPCYGLVEMPFKSADEQSIRRFQVVLVNRADHMAEHRTDMGPWVGNRGLRFPCFGEHTVAEMREMANQVRNENNQWIEEMMQESRETQPLGKLWLDQVEKYKAIVANRSVIGPHAHTQRDGFHKE